MQMRLRMIWWPVRRVVEFPIMLHHPGKHIALDAHESGRRFGNFNKAVSVHMIADRFVAMALWVEGVICKTDFELLTRHLLRQSLFRPIHVFKRIHPGAHVMI